MGHKYLKLSRENDRPTHNAQVSRPTIQSKEEMNANSFSSDVRMTSFVTDSEPNIDDTGAMTEDDAHGNVTCSFSGKLSTWCVAQSTPFAIANSIMSRASRELAAGTGRNHYSRRTITTATQRPICPPNGLHCNARMRVPSSTICKRSWKIVRTNVLVDTGKVLFWLSTGEERVGRAVSTSQQHTNTKKISTRNCRVSRHAPAVGGTGQ